MIPPLTADPSLEPLVELRAVSRAYSAPGGEFLALVDVSLAIGSGEFAAVVGKSGSGKSTLVNLIAGIDRPTAGSVRVAGTAVDSLGEGALAAWRGRHVGIVFQFFQLLPTLTIAENVMLPMDFCRTLPAARARRRARELLAVVGIPEQADKLPSALSGGQQQRAAIARALANDPPVLLADEPTGNLDSQTAQSVLELLASLSREGKTVVTVTHERDIGAFADRVITLVDGRVVDIAAGGAHRAGARGEPAGARGEPAGARGEPAGARGEPAGARGEPAGARGASVGARGESTRG